MDQVRNAITQLKKFHFWILCVIVTVIGFAGWWIATGSLDTAAASSAQDIKAKADEVKQVLNVNPHPNQTFTEGMEAIIRSQAISIAKGWRAKYEQQEDLLVWPKRLGQDFIDQVDDLRPIEKWASFPVKDGEEIDVQYRDIYRNFIILELPELASQIGAKWSVEGATGESSSPGGMSSGLSRPTPSLSRPSSSGMSRPSLSRPSSGGYSSRSSRGYEGASGEEEIEEDEPIVYWDASNQAELLAAHFAFISEESSPRTIDVLYAQEDLWALQAIVNVIKRTNGDADANYNAPIKEIQFIQLGRSVIGQMGMVSQVYVNPVNLLGAGNSTGVPGQSGYPGSEGASMPAAPVSSSPTTMDPSAQTELLDPALGRYVDVDYKPLPPKDLREALTSEDPKLAIYSVAKRMPVRMRFWMDQRKLNDLLAECGNSSLPIEVRQVRINAAAGLASPSAATSGSSSYGSEGSSAGPTSGGYSSMMPKSSPSMSYGSSGSSSSSSRRRSSGSTEMSGSYGNSSSTAETVDPNEVEVEVFGIIHLYNPVNNKLLQIELQEDQPAEATETPETPEAPTAGLPVTEPTAG